MKPGSYLSRIYAFLNPISHIAYLLAIICLAVSILAVILSQLHAPYEDAFLISAWIFLGVTGFILFFLVRLQWLTPLGAPRPQRPSYVSILRSFSFVMLGVIPLIYIILRLSLLPASWFVDGQAEQALLDATMAGLAATVFGIAAGVPTAFWLSNKQQQATEAKEKEEEKEERATRMDFVLEILRGELIENKAMLEKMIEDQKVEPGVYPIAGMKNVNWKVFSDTGELKWITHLYLLHYLSEAYYHINALINLELQFLNPEFDTTPVRTVHDRTRFRGSTRIVSHVHSERLEALKHVDTALHVIDFYNNIDPGSPPRLVMSWNGSTAFNPTDDKAQPQAIEKK